MFTAPNHNYGHSSACSSMPSTSTALDPSVAAMLPYDLQEVLQRNATSVLFRAVTKGGFQPFAVQLIDLNRRSKRPGFSIEGHFIFPHSLLLLRLSRSHFRLLYDNNEFFLDLKREIQILRTIKHPYIIDLIDTYQYDKYFCVVFEYMEGRDLCLEVVERAAAGFVYSEFVISHYVRQLLNALSYCVDRDIIHRDIRLECAILANNENSAPLKLGGFHLAVQLPDSSARIQGTKVGTISQMAPEVVKGEPYNFAVDMWSVGILVFVLLSGTFPFSGQPEEIFSSIVNGQYKMQNKSWNQISDFAKDFVVKLLTVDSRRRMNVSQALKHPWIQDKENCAQKVHLVDTVCFMHRFNAHRNLKRRIISSVNSLKWSPDGIQGGQEVIEPQYLSHDQSASAIAVRKLFLSLDQIASICEGDRTVESCVTQNGNGTTENDLIDILELYDHANLVSLRLSGPPWDARQRLENAVEQLANADHIDHAIELQFILNSPDIKILFHTIDVIAAEIFAKLITADGPPQLNSIGQAAMNHGGSAVDDLTCSSSDLSLSPITRVRLIQFQRNTDEPMGITMKINEEGKCIIARIMHGGMVHRQGTLHVGDEVREINGISTTNESVEKLQRLLRDLRGSVYVRAQFDYDPSHDDLIPCPQAGIPFRTGDILHVISKDDYNWWQARHVASFPSFGPSSTPAQCNSGTTSLAGLIPSPELQEWRTACLAMEHAKSTFPCLSISKRKRHQFGKHFFKSRSIIDRLDLATYEEVVRLPTFRRKTLVLLGANGVGRRHIKNTLIQRHPERYAYPIPHTTRPPRRDEIDGQHYYFIDHEAMLSEVQKNEYLEYGTHEDYMYGTKLDTIRAIHRAGKIAILDVEPQALKILRTAEYSPFIIFIAAPDLYGLDDPDGSLERLVRESELLRQAYGHFFDYIIVNNDIDDTIKHIEMLMEKLHLSPQWIPVSWVY
ncbi:peripheral plasma membrane protein CASK [Trichuris trichiura]|uniref:Peripheral plasma membrane protein CASK n=1 Tax=Trichuris trichiura TaxID=36087 RepID=A0A077Z7U2_TRITR|nr:peripheral plasma membrane protein CASK [Trichuris trichiura]